MLICFLCFISDLNEVELYLDSDRALFIFIFSKISPNRKKKILMWQYQNGSNKYKRLQYHQVLLSISGQFQF